MGGERGDAGFSATSKSGSTSLFNIGWLVAVLEVGAHGKGDTPVMTWRTVVVLGAAAITIEDKRARDTPDTSREVVVFLCTIVSRSEERRVGKECRTRWGWNQKK